MNNLEKQLIEKLKESGIDVIVSSKEEDYSGYDITVGNKKIDLKAQTTNSKYDTILLSLRHRNKNGDWILPGYLRRNDIYVWCYDDGDNCIWEISPEKLHSIELFSTKFYKKSAETDYFNNEHILAVLPKTECTKIFLKRRIKNDIIIQK